MKLKLSPEMQWASEQAVVFSALAAPNVCACPVVEPSPPPSSCSSACTSDVTDRDWVRQRVGSCMRKRGEINSSGACAPSASWWISLGHVKPMAIGSHDFAEHWNTQALAVFTTRTLTLSPSPSSSAIKCVPCHTHTYTHTHTLTHLLPTTQDIVQRLLLHANKFFPCFAKNRFACQQRIDYSRIPLPNLFRAIGEEKLVKKL